MPCSGLRRRRTDEGKGGMICHAETIIVQYFIDEESQLKVVRRYVSIAACIAATQKALVTAAKAATNRRIPIVIGAKEKRN